MKCPICGRPAAARFRPFCSGRCADVDLGRWLNGAYALPTDEPPEDDAQTPQDGIADDTLESPGRRGAGDLH